MARFTKCAIHSIAAASLVGLSVAAAAQPVGPGMGQRSGRSSGWGPGMMMGPGMMGGSNFSFMCNPRTAGLAEWRSTRIESEVKPTEAQKRLLDDVKAASTKAAELLNATCSSDVPTKPVERMALMEKRAEAGLQAIRPVRPAFEKFYTSLDDAQKAKLDALGPRRWGWRNWHWRDR